MKYNYTDKKLKPLNEGKSFITEIIIKTEIDDNPDLSYLTQNYNDVIDDNEREKYLSQDKERLDQYYRGNWFMIGISCYAIAYLPIGNNNYKMQEIDSSGLWGIESDSNETDLNEVKNEQIEELKGYLTMLNIDIPDNIKITDKSN